VRGRFAGPTADLRDVCNGAWTEALKANPVLFADESTAPKGSSDTISSGAYREFTGGTIYNSKERYHNDVQIDGVFRVIMSANNLHLLRFREFTTRDDYDAVVERTLHVRFTEAGSRYLEAMDGRTFAEGWGEPDGPVAEHIAWLRENRAVKPGPRFAAVGKETDLHRGWLLTMPALQNVLACIVGDLVQNKPRVTSLSVHGRDYLVDPTILHRHWGLFNVRNGSRAPDPGKVRQSVGVLGRPQNNGKVLVAWSLVEYARKWFEVPYPEAEPNNRENA
jgi:hypothetical protein